MVLAELARRGETLAILESGTGGRLAGKLTLCEHGKTAFTVGKTIAMAITTDLTELALQATIEARADWGLSCVVDTNGKETQLGAGLWNANVNDQWRRGFGGHPALAPEWSANLALDALKRALSATELK